MQQNKAKNVSDPNVQRLTSAEPMTRAPPEELDSMLTLSRELVTVPIVYLPGN
jgi:hypothetical protein